MTRVAIFCLSVLLSVGVFAAPSLWDAVAAGDAEAAAQAIAGGANANEARDDQTLLHVAVEADNATLVRLLLEAGAHPNVMVVRQMGMKSHVSEGTLLEWAQEHSSREVADLLRLHGGRARMRGNSGPAVWPYLAILLAIALAIIIDIFALGAWLRRRQLDREAFARVLAALGDGNVDELLVYLDSHRNLSRARWKSVLFAAISTGQPELAASIVRLAVEDGPDATWWEQVYELARILDDPHMAAVLLDVAQRQRCAQLGVEPFPGPLHPFPPW